MPGESFDALFLESEVPLDAALVLKRTGTVLGAWTRRDVNLEVLSVMSATLLGSVESIALAVGCESPETVRVESDHCQWLATRLSSQAVLVLLAPREVSEARLRRSAREISARLESHGAMDIPRPTPPATRAPDVPRPLARRR